MARFAGAKRLAITHHDPLRDDAMIDEIVARLRDESRRTAGPEVFAAAEGEACELAAPVSVAAAAPDFSAQAAVGEALVGRSALLAMETPAKIESLAAILREDDVHVIVSSLAAASFTAAREHPMLVLVEDTGDDRAAAACRALRSVEGFAEVPIVLVSSAAEKARGADGLFTDVLVAPYSPVYARARLRAWLLRAACRWVRAPMPDDEDRRVAVTRGLGLFNTAPEERFDRVTRLAAATFDTPIALIALMERDHEWFKSTCGLDFRKVPRDESFCGHSVFSRRPLVVEDALLDERFADNPYVTGPPGVRFYAGYPLILDNGSCVGTICVLDMRPRHFDNVGLERLRDMSEIVVRELELTK
jgi:DNA-binding response OmpR family regulator